MWSLALLAGVSVVCAASITKRQGMSPLSAGLWVWVVALGLLLTAPIPYAPISGTALAIVGVGLLSMTTVGLLMRPEKVSEPVAQGHHGVAFARLLIMSAGCLVAVVLGALAFRSQIASGAGAEFSSLSLSQVRAAQTSVNRAGGLLGLFGALTPLLACLGVYGATRYSRLWLVLPAIALAVSLQSPARLATLTMVVQAAVFYLYLRDRPTERVGKVRREGNAKRYLVVAAVAAGAITIFNVVGERLGKNALASSYAPAWDWPGWMLTPVLYFTGGVPALSISLASENNPYDGQTSIYALLRVASAIDPSAKAPDSLAQFALIPFPFNVYTGFGQAWWDFGWVGVAVLFALLAALATVAHRNARAGAVEWAWVAAVVTGLLLTTPQAYRLFYLDIDMALLAGFLAFRFIRKARRTGPGRRLGPFGSGGLEEDPGQDRGPVLRGREGSRDRARHA